MRPFEVAARETYEFVKRNITAANLRILEVGCGNGELARKLLDDGYQITALDSSEEAVANAKTSGLNAIVANWPDFDDAPFDCILFSRTLHHIHPLSRAVIRVNQLLKPSGLLLVEDFAFSDVHEQAAEWFFRLLSLLDACGILVLKEGVFGTKLLRGEGAFELWHDHIHEINSADAVFEAIRQEFEILENGAVPYFYRYLSEIVEDDERGARVVSMAFNLEKATGAQNQAFLMGRRFVARKANQSHDGSDND